MANFEAKNTVKQGTKRQKDKWYPFHACTGGGETYCRACLRHWGWSGWCLFLIREMTESRQKRGGKRIVGGGVQETFLGSGFTPNLGYIFHPPPPVFHPPLPLSDIPFQISQAPQTRHRTQKNRRSLAIFDSDLKVTFSRGWCTICRHLRQQKNIYTTPRIAITMFNMVFVGVVRGLFEGNFQENLRNPRSLSKFRRFTIRGAQPSATLSEESCLSEGS